MYNTSYQAASAVITGSEKYPDIRGLAVFVPTELGTMVSVSVYGLPKSEGECQCGVFAMHIHEGMTCTGNAEDPFADVKGITTPTAVFTPATRAICRRFLPITARHILLSSPHALPRRTLSGTQ